jgi:hypothetical protein
MINVGISYRFFDNYPEFPIPKNIQLSYKMYEDYEKNREFILDTLEKNNINLLVSHLPLDTLKTDFEKIEKMITEIAVRTGCSKFVIHPNRNIYNFLDFFIRKIPTPITLCIETFGWKSRKVFRTPLDIMWAIERYGNGRMSMVIDTSHIESMWFDYKIMPSLLRYTSIIHLSNRAKGVGQHLPFNHGSGKLNLVSFINDLKNKYKWQGDIILEYMTEYRHKLFKNEQYIREVLK